jgi:hypothetical protein
MGGPAHHEYGRLSTPPPPQFPRAGSSALLLHPPPLLPLPASTNTPTPPKVAGPEGSEFPALPSWPPQRLPRYTLVVHRSCTFPPKTDTRLPALTICTAAVAVTHAACHCHGSFSGVLISHGHTSSEHVRTALDIPSLPCSRPIATSTLPRPHSSTGTGDLALALALAQSQSHACTHLATRTITTHAHSRTAPTNEASTCSRAHGILLPTTTLLTYGRCSLMTRSGALTCPPPWRAVVVSEGGAGRLRQRLQLSPVLSPVPLVPRRRCERTEPVTRYLLSCSIVLKIKIQYLNVMLMLISFHQCNGKSFHCPLASFSCICCLNIV